MQPARPTAFRLRTTTGSLCKAPDLPLVRDPFPDLFVNSPSSCPARLFITHKFPAKRPAMMLEKVAYPAATSFQSFSVANGNRWVVSRQRGSVCQVGGGQQISPPGYSAIRRRHRASRRATLRWSAARAGVVFAVCQSKTIASTRRAKKTSVVMSRVTSPGCGCGCPTTETWPTDAKAPAHKPGESSRLAPFIPPTTPEPKVHTYRDSDGDAFISAQRMPCSTNF
ncbi:hypothetical protein BC567DRAFT_86884 [Phyllosticta citribraziliensis]